MLTDISSFTIMANRFVSNVPGCTQIVDAIATDEALSGKGGASTELGATPRWRRCGWMRSGAPICRLKSAAPGAARCNRNTNRRIPWTPQIRGYFLSHFHYLPQVGVFIRDGLSPRQPG